MKHFLQALGLAVMWQLAGAYRGTIVWPFLTAAYILFVVHYLTKQYPGFWTKVLDRLRKK